MIASKSNGNHSFWQDNNWLSENTQLLAIQFVIHPERSGLQAGDVLAATVCIFSNMLKDSYRMTALVGNDKIIFIQQRRAAQSEKN